MSDTETATTTHESNGMQLEFKSNWGFFSLNWYLFLERCYILSIYISRSKTKRKEEKIRQGDGGDEEKERGK